ncbi:MAG: vanadium-dependent haloperoxidase [Acidobacteriaceae bacterium]|nr:vanadium-dependent haloperoxidase [Acidobacteriaceae bacterium]MBV8571385.1 vanadium-dependent haloperoxidase [Acidobacteriaceae bacterium]
MGTQLAPITPSIANRIERMLAIREATAAGDAFVRPAEQYDNGDEALYADKCGTYTKCIQQAGIGLVDLAAYNSFKTALNSGDEADFNNIILGGPRTLNGPQGGLAFDLQCRDSSQFLVPPAPPLASEEYATELVELYWASLLRDVAFTDYSTNATAINAANELTMMPMYKGPKDAMGKVTPDLLFRGGYPGETDGPYVSQFLLKPTCLGALPITQQYTTFKAGVDYMLDPASYQQVQNGISTGQVLQPAAKPLYLHDGRGLGAYTHNDVLYQAYFVAYLVLQTLNGIDCAVKDNAAPFNPGNPYIGNQTQNGFTTMGPPDFAATMAAVASEALKAVWYQKWYIHLRHRPEAGGALVYLAKTGHGGTVMGLPSNTVLTSDAVMQAHTKNTSYFLSQAFPEGSPAHPAYPTGHGTVAGACITVLKFFYDGATKIPNPVVPKNDGTQLLNYVGPDLTVNGELNKLAHNISFGHGIHPGIHWRSDTDTSIKLGEAVALSVLRDHARTYNEKFRVQLMKVDGTMATISNE